MNPQEQNKATTAPGIQKNGSPKQSVGANGRPADASAKPADKDAKDGADGSTTKGSCGTK